MNNGGCWGGDAAVVGMKVWRAIKDEVNSAAKSVRG